MINICIKKITPSYAKEVLDNRNEDNFRKLKGSAADFVVITGLYPNCAKTIDIGFKRSVEDYLKKFEKMYEKGATAVAMIVDAYKADDKHFNEATTYGKEISKNSGKVLKQSHVGGLYYYLVYIKGYDIGKVRMFFEKLSNYNSAGETTPFKTTYQILQDKDGKLGRSGVDIINAYKRCWNSFVNNNTKNLIALDKCSNDFEAPKAKKECVVEANVEYIV